MTLPKQVACPNCQKLTVYNTDNKFRPFCCERCQLIDLGEWFKEERKIAGDSSVDPEQTPDSAIN